MPDVEAMIRSLAALLVLLAGFMASIVLFKKLRQKPSPDPRISERLADLEQRLADIEERLDFTERVLTEVRSRVQIPPKP